MQYGWLARKAQRSQILRKFKILRPFWISLSAWVGFRSEAPTSLVFPMSHSLAMLSQNLNFAISGITRYKILPKNTGWNPAPSNAHLSKRALNHSAGLIKNQPTKLSTAGYLLNVSSKFSINYRILQPLSRHKLYSQQSCSKCHSRDYFLKSFIFRSDDDDLTTHSPIENWFTFHKFGRFSS